MKNMEERKPVKGDAYDYYISAEEDRDLFEKIFLVDEIIDEIKKPIILFIDGIDARPREIDNEQYFECLTGLVNVFLLNSLLVNSPFVHSV